MGKKGVPHVDPKLVPIATPYECMDNELINKYRENLMIGLLGGGMERVDRRFGSLFVCSLLKARLPEWFMDKHVYWKEGDTYEDICRRRLDLLNGVFPRWEPPPPRLRVRGAQRSDKDPVRPKAPRPGAKDA